MCHDLAVDCGWHVVFDSAHKRFPSGQVLLAAVLIGAGLVMLRGARREGWPKVYTGFAAIYLLMATAINVPILFAVIGQWRHVQSSARSAPVIEGVVEQFHPMPYTGHDTERFVVGDVHFAYSDFSVTAGFNHTSSHGGPIHEGLRVRIHYLGDKSEATIVKLETC